MPAIVLAGGRARRMGGADKPLLPLRGRPILDHVLSGLRGQVGPVAISANGDPARFATWGLPVLPDTEPDWPGPLAGILAGMLWAAGRSARVLSWPGDTPFPPADLVARLLAAGEGCVCAASDGRLHPAIGLWPVALAPTLAEALRLGQRRVAAFAEAHGMQVAHWPGADPFVNVNTPEDLARCGSDGPAAIG